MAIRGSLKEASLPDVLQLLALGQKTGRLTVSDRQNLGHVFFERGRITDAAVVNRRDRLGDILVKSHTITQAQLEAAIEEQASCLLPLHLDDRQLPVRKRSSARPSRFHHLDQS